MTELNLQKIIRARRENGLNEKTSDIKNISKDPTLKYIKCPSIGSKSELIKHRKTEDVILIIIIVKRFTEIRTQ